MAEKATKPRLRFSYREGIWFVTNKFPNETRWDHKRMHGPTLFPAWEAAYRWVIHENTRLCAARNQQWDGKL